MAHETVPIPAAFIDREFIRHRVRVVGECWEWQRAVGDAGYGNVRDNRANRTYKAHRLAYAAFIGDPGNLMVLHRCDNRRCCNPEHLFLGTNDDNMRDMVEKGRSVGHPGAANPNAKLSQAQIDAILVVPRKSLGGRTNAEIARAFGVHKETICRIRRGLKGRYSKEALNACR